MHQQKKRESKRVKGFFPATFYKHCKQQRKLEYRTMVDNVSDKGLYFECSNSIDFGGLIVGVVRLSSHVTIAVKGEIVRTVLKQEDALIGYGVLLKTIRLLPR